jgi:hypothetical protein
MASVIRVFSIPSTDALISVVEHDNRWELIIRHKTGTIRRRPLEPRVGRALVRSLRANPERPPARDAVPNATDP